MSKWNKVNAYCVNALSCSRIITPHREHIQSTIHSPLYTRGPFTEWESVSDFTLVLAVDKLLPTKCLLFSSFWPANIREWVLHPTAITTTTVASSNCQSLVQQQIWSQHRRGRQRRPEQWWRFEYNKQIKQRNWPMVFPMNELFPLHFWVRHSPLDGRLSSQFEYRPLTAGPVADDFLLLPND